MILATRFGNREVRAFESSAQIPTYTQFMGAISPSGVNVTLANAAGLPTVGAAIRLIAETVASLPLRTYTGEGADKKSAKESVPWELLHDHPSPDFSAFDFLSDVAACVESWGNAYVQKVKLRGTVVALIVIDPAIVMPKRDARGNKFYEIRDERGITRLSDLEVIHVRGFTLKGGDVGLSPIQQHRALLGNAIAAQTFQGRFYANDATPSLYMSVPEVLDQTSADRLRANWEAKHGGMENAGSIAILGNGATLNTLSIPLRDAQFIEGQEQSAELAARIFLGPAASLLGSDSNMKTEEDSLRFINFALLPRLARIERAFSSDPDLYPEGSEMYPEFYLDHFLRADAATRAEVTHKEIQTGVLLVDEARAEKGLPPLPDGMGQIPQITPVGGAPNAAPAAPAPQPDPPTQE